MRIPGLLIRTSFWLAIALCFFGCRQESNTPQTVNKPLPPAPAGQLTYAGIPPAHPFGKQAGNHFARTVFEADGPASSHIEVRDVLVPPNANSTIQPLPGVAIMDPASAATVTFSSAGKGEALADGALRSVPAGQALAFQNNSSRPAIIRLYIIRPR